MKPAIMIALLGLTVFAVQGCSMSEDMEKDEMMKKDGMMECKDGMMEKDGEMVECGDMKS